MITTMSSPETRANIIYLPDAPTPVAAHLRASPCPVIPLRLVGKLHPGNEAATGDTRRYRLTSDCLSKEFINQFATLCDPFNEQSPELDNTIDAAWAHAVNAIEGGADPNATLELLHEFVVGSAKAYGVAPRYP